uniref:Uncharacterized protein n=1 Tax=Oryza glaberrima TaxID=4538 RepID=A0A679BB08_ORYGL|nr:hypothetical protein [Oryza glaberrima]BBF89523.1 hypothetical protein [Oryza glaberrima]
MTGCRKKLGNQGWSLETLGGHSHELARICIQRPDRFLADDNHCPDRSLAVHALPSPGSGSSTVHRAIVHPGDGSTEIWTDHVRARGGARPLPRGVLWVAAHGRQIRLHGEGHGGV